MVQKILLLGSGELGKEFVIAAQRLGRTVVACDKYAGAPAMQVADACEVFDMLDGSLTKRPEGGAYYNVVTSFSKIPKRLVKALKIKSEKAVFLSDEFEKLMWEILSGGEIDNNYLTIDRN